MQSCSECGVETDDLVRCDVCGKLLCQSCFEKWHDGNTLPMEMFEAVKNL